MSTVRNLLQVHGDRVSGFAEEFGYYLDSFDMAFSLQSRIGLDRAAMSALPDREQNRFKANLFRTESVNTTVIGALYLLAGNLYSDAFALLRMMYEAACLMHYGNQSPLCGDELFQTMFRSGLDERSHAQGEWKIVSKAMREWESQVRGLAPIRQFINNFGAHISRAKIALGNVTALGNQSASTVFTDNTHKREFVAGMDILHNLFMMVLEEYDRQASSHAGAAPSVAPEAATLNRQYLREVQPRLQKRAGLA